eukprot:6423187-Pyramimonas_sp.AAC.2
MGPSGLDAGLSAAVGQRLGGAEAPRTARARAGGWVDWSAMPAEVDGGSLCSFASAIIVAP